MIYFIQDSTRGLIKIGFTDGLPDRGKADQRLRALQTGNPSKLNLLVVVEGDLTTEAELHGQFSHLREQGEWFRPAPDLIAFLVAEAKRELLWFVAFQFGQALSQPPIG